MGFYSWVVRDRRWEKEAESWRRAGTFPLVVVRTYDDDELYQTDARRLAKLGYEITAQNVETRLFGLWMAHTRVVYHFGPNHRDRR